MKITPEEIEEYCRNHTSALPPLFDELRSATYETLSAPNMQVGLIEGRFLSLLVGLLNAKSILEFGTFSGFSTLAMASALPPDGKIITCDIDPRATSLAREFWNRSEHGKKIELRLGPGVETLANLTGPFDLVFIDADKAGYANYWRGTLPLLRKGGLIVVDNVLWSGRVLAPQDKSDFDIHQFNELAIQEAGMEMVMLPVRDGLLLARKR
jgi:caffeoyl-CoA O-methyltransferase